MLYGLEMLPVFQQFQGYLKMSKIIILGAEKTEKLKNPAAHFL